MPDYAFSPQSDVGIDEYNPMGAVQSAQATAQYRRQMQRPNRERIYNQSPLPQSAAQPHRAVLRSYMGMGYSVWTAADAADKLLVVTPQESFRPERLVIDLSVANGPSAGLVLLRRVEVGTSPQSPSVSQPAPAAMFSAAATYSKLDMQVCYRAMELQVTLGITVAPGGSAVVTAAVGFYGAWIR
jgi:hypothetical protein